MDLLRDGAMETLFGGVRAPSTLGSHLRSYTWGNVRQLDKAHRGLTAALRGTRGCCPARGSRVRRYRLDAEAGLRLRRKRARRSGTRRSRGRTCWCKGLNALIATISTPLAAPVLGPARLRGGNAGSARGAAGLAAEAIGTARECGCTGKILVRMDSAYYNAAVIGTIRRNQGILLRYRADELLRPRRDRRDPR